MTESFFQSLPGSFQRALEIIPGHGHENRREISGCRRCGERIAVFPNLPTLRIRDFKNGILFGIGECLPRINGRQGENQGKECETNCFNKDFGFFEFLEFYSLERRSFAAPESAGGQTGFSFTSQAHF